MDSQIDLKMQQCEPTRPALHPAGHWRLDTGHAVTLQSAAAGVLQIAKGRVWATVDGPHMGPANNLGDMVLNAGERLALQPGQRVVIEPWPADPGPDAGGAAWFSWDAVAVETTVKPLSVTITKPENQEGHATSSRWQVAIAQPWRDFALALALAAHALGRLALGLAGLTEFLVAGRGRVLPPMESNPP